MLRASSLATILVNDYAPSGGRRRLTRAGGDPAGVISVALPNIDDDLGHVLNHVESEWVTASLSVGALVGALGGGTAADRWGRKLVLIVGDAWFLVGAVIVCASYSVPQMIVSGWAGMARL